MTEDELPIRDQLKKIRTELEYAIASLLDARHEAMATRISSVRDEILTLQASIDVQLAQQQASINTLQANIDALSTRLDKFVEQDRYSLTKSAITAFVAAERKAE